MPAAVASQAGDRRPALAGTDARDLTLANTVFGGKERIGVAAGILGDFNDLRVRKFPVRHVCILSGKSFLHRPFMFIEATPKRRLAHTQFARPRRKRLSFPFVGDQIGRSRVAVLFQGSRPAEISSLIVSIVIDSFKALTFGPVAHHLYKTLQGSQFGSDCDASTAIVHVFRPRSIEASSHHVVPDSIFSRSAKPVMRMRLPMSVHCGEILVFVPNAALDVFRFRHTRTLRQFRKHSLYFRANVHRGKSQYATCNTQNKTVPDTL